MGLGILTWLKGGPPDGVFFEGDYPNYESALKACGGDAGYSSEQAINRYIRRFEEVKADTPGAIRQSGLKLLPFISAFALAEPRNGIYEVLDYGGEYGAIYDQLRILFPARRIRWTVIELPALVARAADMGVSDEKQFSAEIPDRPYSLVIASGVLQCLADPKVALDRLCALQTPLMMLSRVPIAPFLTRDRLTMEIVRTKGFGTKFPTWFFAPDWREKVARFGEVVSEWDSPGDVTELDKRRFNFQAYLLRR